MDTLDDKITRQLRPQAADLLRDLVEKYPFMSAVVVVVQASDGGVMAFSAGCSAIESIGLLSLATTTAATAQIRG